jgi:hypothetical protein
MALGIGAISHMRHPPAMGFRVIPSSHSRGRGNPPSRISTYWIMNWHFHRESRYHDTFLHLSIPTFATIRRPLIRFACVVHLGHCSHAPQFRVSFSFLPSILPSIHLTTFAFFFFFIFTTNNHPIMAPPLPDIVHPHPSARPMFHPGGLCIDG